MKLVMIAVRDSATECFGRPFFVATRAQGVRSFTDEVRRVDNGNDLNKHPDDFTLYSLGIFDDSSGMFEPEIVQLVRAKDVTE